MKLRAQIQSGLLVAAALAAATAGAAHAENPSTAQARAYNLDWIARAPDARFGDPAERPVICLLDTGVAITPDTPADSPTGPIVARRSILGDNPLTGDPSVTFHGTHMAASIAAPANDWGVVGIWPGAQILAIKVVANDGTIGGDADQVGIQSCLQWAAANGRTLSAINLSHGVTSAISPAQKLSTEEAIARANQSGATVIAAAGNDAGQGTQWPATAPGALAVGAGTADGAAWCSFASHDQLTTLVAPGCDVEAADDSGAPATWPGAGSSYATTVATAVVAALRALRPDADRKTVESWVSGTSRLLDTSHLLDGAQIAAAAGVADLATPAPAIVPPAPIVHAAPSAARVRHLSRHRLFVSAARGQGGFKLEAAIRVHGHWRKASGKRTLTVSGIPSTPARIWVRWRSTTAPSSAWAPLGRPSRKPSKRTWKTTTRRGPTPPA